MDTYEIGEFASYELKEDKQSQTFTIVIDGPLKYSTLIGVKLGEVWFTEADLRKFVED
jgi:hypothetical protein